MVSYPPEVGVRFIALDVHKRYIVAAGVDQQQHIALDPRRMPLEEVDRWAQKMLRPSDVVVLEAMSSTWDLYDLLSPFVGAVVVANPARVALIAKSRVKTDANDALVLARLLAGGLLPTVWVPPMEVRELRGLLAHRQRLVWQRTRTRNRLRAVLVRHSLVAPEGEIFSPAHRSWWSDPPLSTSERLRVRQDLTMLDTLVPLTTEVETEIVRLSRQDPWKDQVAYLMQLPGVAVLNAMTLLAAIGDVERFPSPNHLVGYAGLGAQAHHSGQTHYGGHITKQGRRDLRVTMVEAAWMAVGTHPFWRVEFQRLSSRLGPHKAIVAIARKLLVVVWHVLHERQADHHALPEKIARKFLIWAEQLRRDGRGGLTRGAFIRTELDRIGIGADLQAILQGRHTVQLTPPPAPAGSAHG